MIGDSCVSAMIDHLMSLLLGTKTLFLKRMMPSSRVQLDKVVRRGGVDCSLRHLIIPLMNSSFDDKDLI